MMSKTMTVQPITDEQREKYKQYIEDAANKALLEAELGKDVPAGRRNRGVPRRCEAAWRGAADALRVGQPLAALCVDGGAFELGNDRLGAWAVPQLAISHRSVRGGSFATRHRMRNPRYRNYYEPQRDDIFVGFRSCRAG